jgi:hypothetical protein
MKARSWQLLLPGSFCFINKALQERLDQKLGPELPAFRQYKTTPWKRGHVF